MESKQILVQFLELVTRGDIEAAYDKFVAPSAPIPKDSPNKNGQF